MDARELAKYIDHTNLKAFATREDIKRLCEEAKEYGFYAVCVNPYRVKDAAEFLKGTDIKIASVVGFPLGATFTETKVQEAIMAVRNGADEIDMVMNIGAMKDGDYGFVERDIREVVEAVHPMGAKVKVIIETCYLSDEEKIKACELAKKAGADFVKTSTGFGTAGAKVEDVKLMRSVVGNDMGVKAAGGIHNAKQAIAMIEAGATRIGASRSVEIIETLELI
ncbi:deoxyribose-phosphate aldolase [Candidatus Aciduliprofundum boonei]|uniref:Deoxyribose-phosphate aldolase n=1 Tax=Aciduliprofundum boonei (strain DSM 19572 / T469) TaxID=439481 RepID=DEOC_ACIB4|nr:deoxyribose-phosphate aldolase [Candidatus Aciduliprofundum boonei]B5IEU6.1 RecName: Full=Deoxyribose-phosphate aldolase; Short=DERA; AltName: Full=2-deoxy-D-ribose 5-phosphate aldolase; AltName: Full=Phosphodeoxyriboaldolase; Short=Deoxyriboaldolase [Aciduliprofundum boonei T469]ADD07968.1 deoxyribose-phosphate aldolase [Aciduliprofundum boonei T469]EDY35261.1 deoxyribose-phosphate aldolase [Aciduliprofundum boonei T469]HII55163.1 deoxyribose-phosphate aldolase [Candidatus Aciduliprofundum 